MQTPSSGSRPILITEIDQFGGSERSVLALSRWLHQRNLPNHVVTYFDRCNLAQYATHPLQVVELKPSPGARHKVASLRTYFNQQPPNSPKPLASGYQPALHATLAGQRGFHTLMHDTPSLFGDQDTRRAPIKLRIAVSNRIIGYGLRSGGNTIVTSEYLRSECRKDFNIDAKIARMGGLVTSPAAQLAHPVNDQLRMFSVCRIEPNKRIDWIIRALAKLERNEKPLSSLIDWRLDLAGKGSLIPSLTQMAQTLGIGDRIHFHGFVPDDDLERLFSQTHLFLMPAVQGYGIPAIESLHRGIPVLLHRESGVSDILLDTPWATVFTGGEENMTPALQSAIEGILEDKHHVVPQPHLPTEDEWAERVATLCNWL
ncbi:glycosyltransferase family 4 protein [Tunturibacter empetritectus]|uniref:Glycosyltransferase involved in cell wall biosynthesis n=1 Tax=Tunturiibacter lichenicola TaxID=2051959 RepID=A0A7W8N6M2_9BACT|nr:glycosyltransferase [Edaphobacter lichenicola]MBB5345766.1 glycosyltransferase involved in cell wall biosynthesis [Edaphobacter lichenicola]